VIEAKEVRRNSSQVCREEVDVYDYGVWLLTI